MTCEKLDPFVTPYIDGELGAVDRVAVEAHLRACPPCYSRVSAERIVREALRGHRAALKKERAPADLRARCALAAGAAWAHPAPSEAPPSDRAWWPLRSSTGPRRHLRPIALAATLVLLVGGAFVYELTDRSAQVMAAELTVDHLKCFAVNRVLGTHQAPAAVEGSIASSFGTSLHLPVQPEGAGLELVGERPCLYGQGRMAHIMYRHHGNPVSVFMLPGTMRSEEVVDVMGHEAAIWSAGGRTFVLIAREPRIEVERMASFVHASLR